MDKNEDSLITGLMAVVVKDYGPDLIANFSQLDENEAFLISTQLLTISGFSEAQDEDKQRIIGPMPAGKNSDINALLYFHNVANHEAQDERLVAHGSILGVILLFDTKKSPEIRRAIGLLEPHLKRYLHENLTDLKQMNQDLLYDLFHHTVDLVSKPAVRSFWFDTNREEPALVEYRDPHAVFKERDLVIIDEHLKEVYVLVSPVTSMFDARKLYNAVNSTNMKVYKNSLKIQIKDNFDEIEPLMHKYGIKTI